jgi:HTH-type transcriptional regulator, glycine betaine synthesis regulator
MDTPANDKKQRVAISESASDPRLLAVHDSMLDGLGQLANYFGFSKVTGQIFGALLLSAKPLCLDDLVELLDISKASASTTMRTLENMGMVREVWVRGNGGRRKFYEAESNFWKIITNILSSREMRDVERALRVMEQNAKQLNNAMSQLQPEERDLANLYLDRIGQMQVLFEFAQMMISAILAQTPEGDSGELPSIDLKPRD